VRLLLDTTYLLPVIGISVKGLPRNAVIELIKRGHEILISEITLFELSAKGAKYVVLGTLTVERVLRGVRALLYDDRVSKIPAHDTAVLLTAFKLRKVLSDFIDCLILSSAINRADVLVTEDKNILGLLNVKEFQELVQGLNPVFKVRRLKEVL